jgi:hypothetical protein
VNDATAVAILGPPTKTVVLGGYRVLIWQGDMLPRLNNNRPGARDRMWPGVALVASRVA